MVWLQNSVLPNVCQDLTNLISSRSVEINDNNHYSKSSISQCNTSLETIMQPVVCIAYKDRNFPTGMHKCKVYGISVNILDGCSVEDPESKDDEGYGQKRICIKCFENFNISIQFFLNEI